MGVFRMARIWKRKNQRENKNCHKISLWITTTSDNKQNWILLNIFFFSAWPHILNIKQCVYSRYHFIRWLLVCSLFTYLHFLHISISSFRANKMMNCSLSTVGIYAFANNNEISLLSLWPVNPKCFTILNSQSHDVWIPEMLWNSEKKKFIWWKPDTYMQKKN